MPPEQMEQEHAIPRSLHEWARMLAKPGTPALRDASGHKGTVCIIGAGPAGLQAAFTLQKNGCSVVVLEALPAPGLTLLNVPALEGSSSAAPLEPATRQELGLLVESLQERGVLFRCSSPAGQSDIDALSHSFQAVLVACGRGASVPADSTGFAGGNMFAAGTCVKNNKTADALKAILQAKATAGAICRFLSRMNGTPCSGQKRP